MTQVFVKGSLRPLWPLWPLWLLASALLIVALSRPAMAEEAPEPNQESGLNINPFDTDGLDGKVAEILEKYYEQTFGGAENWETVQSVQFDGVLHLPQGETSFVAFKKKPDYCKVIISTAGGGRLVLGYDGVDAWQFDTSLPNAQPVDMPAEVALGFIRDATIAGHLVYPLLEGKQLKFLGAGKVGGESCYMIEQILPDGQRIVSALGVRDFAEHRQKTVNPANGLEEQTTFSDFREVAGVRFPFASVVESNGEIVHRVEMKTIRVNVGLAHWVFQKPSETILPKHEKESSYAGLKLFKPSGKKVPVEQDPGFGVEEETAFPDLKQSELDSILDDIGNPDE